MKNGLLALILLVQAYSFFCMRMHDNTSYARQRDMHLRTMAVDCRLRQLGVMIACGSANGLTEEQEVYIQERSAEWQSEQIIHCMESMIHLQSMPCLLALDPYEP